MAKTVRYSSTSNKMFYMKKKNYRLKKEVKLFLLIILLSLTIFLSYMSFKNAFSSTNNTNVINYNEKGIADYTVYLKDNTHFDSDILPSGMEYVANIIDTVKMNFNYEIHTTEKLNFNYDYTIDAQLVIKKHNEEGILDTKNYNLVTSDGKDSTKDLFINEVVEINYDDYNAIVNDFKNQYGVSIDSYLVVSLNVSTVGSNNDLDKDLVSDNIMSINVPLSEQTVNVEIPTDTIDNVSYITDYDNVQITNPLFFGLMVMLGLVALIILFIIFKVLYKLFYNGDIYDRTIKKYLREYDRLIVTSRQPDLDEESFANKIRVMSIEELIDAHDSTGSPIIYYEVIPNEKSYFVIIDNSTIYKLTISRVYLENEKNSK